VRYNRLHCPSNHSLLKSYTEKLVHKGLDSEGFYEDDRISLGIRRLRIVDLEMGDQPIHNETETVWVVFNGEIYNYISLRKRLEGKGHRFIPKYWFTSMKTIMFRC
jgi:asparagine synthase (glutamine-hydrolysing)